MLIQKRVTYCLVMFLSADDDDPRMHPTFESNGSRVHDSQMDMGPEEPPTGDSRIPTHPLGVKPLGNQYLFDGPSARQSIGTLQILPDEMLAQLLEYLEPQQLRVLGYTCRFLYAHSFSEELWKALFLE